MLQRLAIRRKLRALKRKIRWPRPLFAAYLLTSACSNGGPLLSKSSEEIPSVPVPAANGPKLGAVADLTPILERPAPGARSLGYLHAGARVARAEEPYTRRGCDGGFYPVRPRGFVCAKESATTDMSHPTLAAMALSPSLDRELPYTYARTRLDTALYERDPNKDDAVREVGKLKKRSGLAVVGSWTALDPTGKSTRLALMTNGRFVRAEDLEAAEISNFAGVELESEKGLPVAFIVKRGVLEWTFERDEPEKFGPLTFHAPLELTGRFRNVGEVKFWQLADSRWVRHRDATLVPRRTLFPDMARGAQKWVDISVITGQVVLYEGKRPVYATVASLSREIESAASEATPNAGRAQLGTFAVVAKHISFAGKDPKLMGENFSLYDLPWALELESGGLVHGAYWHDRFGVEFGNGSVQLSPKDAARLWAWATPELPEGWHGVNGAPAEAERRTFIVIRK